MWYSAPQDKRAFVGNNYLDLFYTRLLVKLPLDIYINKDEVGPINNSRNVTSCAMYVLICIIIPATQYHCVRDLNKMGADESKISVGQLRSRRDEDIPYTSYSISKPIDGDTPRPSPMRGRTRNVSPQPRGREPFRSGASHGPHDIVVVAEGTTQQETDSELIQLEKIPVFVPLMRGSLNIPSLTKEVDVLDKLSSEELLSLCHRYQEHLRQCGEAVAFDQNALCVRIKEVDITIQTIYNHLTDRQRKFAKYAEQIQKVNEMSTVLNKIKMNVEQLIPVMDRLNSILPPEDQLEPFTMKLKC